MYRQLAEQAEDVFIKQELLELAADCEEVANNVEDRLDLDLELENPTLTLQPILRSSRVVGRVGAFAPVGQAKSLLYC